VTQELITDLRRFEGLRLFSVPASFRQDEHADPTRLGANLGVDYVIKGSIGEDAATVRLAAQLYNARTGEVLWSDIYDRAPSVGALLALRAEFAAEVATALGQQYGAVAQDMTARLTGSGEPSLSSYACVLKAYAYRRTFRQELRAPVRDCLDAAVKRDPDYPEPWAMLGWLRLDAVRYGIVPDAEVPAQLDAAVELGRKAVALEPDNIIALQALSAIEYHRGNFDESERIQREALALNPNDPDTLAQLSWRLAFRGRWAEGLAYNEKARARAISPPGWYYDPMTIYLYVTGRYSEMLPYAEHSAAEDPQGLAFVAIAHAALGDRKAARDALARMTELDPAFARDPRVSWRRFLPLDTILDPLMEGLRKAGWKDPVPDPVL
jgi:tetratricopeptide (TPR) repeat protein